MYDTIRSIAVNTVNCQGKQTNPNLLRLEVLLVLGLHAHHRVQLVQVREDVRRSLHRRHRRGQRSAGHVRARRLLRDRGEGGWGEQGHYRRFKQKAEQAGYYSRKSDPKCRDGLRNSPVTGILADTYNLVLPRVCTRTCSLSTTAHPRTSYLLRGSCIPIKYEIDRRHMKHVFFNYFFTCNLYWYATYTPGTTTR